MLYDFTDENQAKEYLHTVGIEYRFQCYHEKRPDGCHRLADFLEAVKKEYEKAATVYKSNCDDNKYGHSCFKFGSYKVVGRGGEKNVDQGLDYFLKGCEYEYAPACHSAGLLLQSKKLGSVHDPTKGLQLLQHACDQKYVSSCYQLSGWFIQGVPGITKDMTKAFEYAKKACDLGNCYSCSNLSQMYKKGEGVEKDDKMAEEYREKAKELYQEMIEARRNLELNQ